MLWPNVETDSVFVICVPLFLVIVLVSIYFLLYENKINFNCILILFLMFFYFKISQI